MSAEDVPVTGTLELMDVTPAIARAWLDLGRTPGGIGHGLIDRLAAMIRAGQWDPEPVLCIGPRGPQRGWHRLQAIVRTGATARSRVHLHTARRCLVHTAGTHFRSRPPRWQHGEDVGPPRT